MSEIREQFEDPILEGGSEGDLERESILADLVDKYELSKSDEDKNKYISRMVAHLRDESVKLNEDDMTLMFDVMVDEPEKFAQLERALLSNFKLERVNGKDRFMCFNQFAQFRIEPKIVYYELAPQVDSVGASHYLVKNHSRWSIQTWEYKDEDGDIARVNVDEGERTQPITVMLENHRRALKMQN